MTSIAEPSFTPAERRPWSARVRDLVRSVITGAHPLRILKHYRYWLVYPALAVIIGLFSYALACYYSGAHGGVDQNGYLVTARLLLEKHAISFKPESPFQFVGRMMIVTEDGRVFAKYPFGFPLLAAFGRAIAGPDGMYWINPLCTAIACLAAFFMFRTVVRDFVALMGVILLACNPLTLYYANDSNSHASTLCCVCVGFWALLSWMRNGSIWRGLLGGFALGYACTIRYSEFLLVLPVTFASLSTIALVWKRREMSVKRFINGLTPLLGWAIPIAALSLVCWVSFGAPWKTGYTYCKEDTGFSWKYFLGDPSGGTQKVGNWETFVLQINHTGLFFMWPLALLGLFAMPRKHRRVAFTLALWIVPATLLYLCYYWAPGGENTINYMRFFLTVIPGMLLAALWLLDSTMQHLHNTRWANWLSLIAATAGSAALAFALLYCLPPDAGESGSWRYVVVALLVPIVIGMWLKERDHAGQHFAPALAVAALTLATAFVNLWLYTNVLENNLAGQTTLRETVAHIHDAIPPGKDTVLFADDNFCNELDALGGYQLYGLQLFSPLAFAGFKHVVDDPERKPGEEVDPNPLQRARAQAYMELLGKKNALGNWIQKPADELRRQQLAIINKALQAHQRVTFLLHAEDGKTPIPAATGLDIRQIATWTTTPQVVVNPRWAGVRFQAITRAPIAWALWEVVPAPATTAKAK